MSRFFLRFLPIFIALFLIAAIFLTRTLANAAENPGESCLSLGVSTMAANRQNLIACLQDEKGNLVWKSMTGQTSNSLPVGMIMAWPVAANPEDMQNANGTFNWLDCNGQTIPPSLYPELYKKIGAKTPDLRGLFLRGQGGQSAALGQQQNFATEASDLAARYPVPILGKAVTGLAGGHQSGMFVSGLTMQNGQLGSVTSSQKETRPINMAVRYLIRARS